jgi:hypothetical protein
VTHYFPQGIRKQLQKKFIHSRVRINLQMQEKIHGLRILVLGIYLADREHCTKHLMERYGESQLLQVTQRWVALNGIANDSDIREKTLLHPDQLIPKFVLLNQLMQGVNLQDYDFVLISDDDIAAPKGFLDAYIANQIKYDFSLAQPARTLHSYFDHRFCLHRPWLRARETRFVEIGPVFSLSRNLFSQLLPFDESSPMGWGYDRVWPVIINNNKLKMGIIDCVRVDHSYRPQGVSYSKAENKIAMNNYLAQHAHLHWREARKTIHSYFW